MEKKISYLNRNYNDYREALIEYSNKYYPDLAINYDDASVGSWMIDLNAEIADNLSYHIDRVFQETNVNSANETSSLYNIARNLGVKIPGPKGSMAEVKFTCTLPLAEGDGANGNRVPDWRYAPTIKRGTKVSSSSQSFELLYDVDFKEQFNDDGYSDRTIVPVRNSNGLIIKYRVTKLAVVIAGESRIYTQSVYSSNIYPFMEIVVPIKDVMNIESIIVRDGTNLQTYPTYGEFYMNDETSEAFPSNTRFFEVDALAQQFRWGEDVKTNDGKKYSYGYLDESGNTIQTYSVTKGEWKPVQHKFITEYTDKGYLKITFGSGVDANVDIETTDMSDFAKYQISKTIKNDGLGLLPKPNTTIFVLYRVGGGKSSNVAKGAINTLSKLAVDICSEGISATKVNAVRESIEVVNTTPSVSGKDMPTGEELKNFIKYYKGAQERCVTLKDYIARVQMLPPKYGTPFRVGAAEENNKIMLYLLGIDYLGKLDASLPQMLVSNVQNYLAEYRSINDFVEIKSGRIINLSFEVDAYIDKNYNKADVITTIINTINNYMDINKHIMGDDIFVGDLEKEISKIDGVINLIDFRVYNETGEGYSSTQTTQEIVSYSECSQYEKDAYNEAGRLKIDLEASDGIIYSDGDTMLEVKYPTKDVRVRVKLK